jgi:predicted esterase
VDLDQDFNRPGRRQQVFNKPRTLVLTLAAGLSFASGAFALNYSGRQGNKATFETLEEARVNGPAAAAAMPGNRGRNFKSHPVLDACAKGTTFVYRSANLYGGRAARSNTNILVYSDKSFQDKDAALAYLKGLGVIDIIDQAVGSVVLVTPANPRTGFAAADQKGYYALQTAMLSLRASERVNNVVTTFTDGEYFGGFGFLYVIGVDGGATFFNNYIAPTFDYSSRLAGVLLFNGGMDEDRRVASALPAYLVNPAGPAEAQYKTANETNAVKGDAGVTTYYNQALPLQQVKVSKGAVSDGAAVVKKAYAEMFSRTMRIPVVRQGSHSAGTPYQGYSFDQAPYSLAARNVVTNGATPGGISVTTHQEDLFSSIKTTSGEYLQTWTEYVPKEVLEGKAAPGSVPLVLALHGGGDDPEAFVEECGWLELAHQKRFIMVAPEHQALDNTPAMGEGLQALAQYMMKTYPAVDASRVYASGYSMGGIATLSISTSHPRLLAAAVNMAGAVYTFTKDIDERFQNTDLPFMFLTSAYDSTRNIKWEDGSLTKDVQTLLNKFLAYNEMEQVSFDFAARPKHGFPADAWSDTLLNNEHRSYVWYRNNKQNVPMVALSYTMDLIHALYPGYAQVAWDYLSRFSRDQKTGAVVYHPNTK